MTTKYRFPVTGCTASGPTGGSALVSGVPATSVEALCVQLPTTVLMFPGIIIVVPTGSGSMIFTFLMQKLPASVMYALATPPTLSYQNVTCVGALRDAYTAGPPSPLYDRVPFPANTSRYEFERINGLGGYKRYTTFTVSSARRTGSKLLALPLPLGSIIPEATNTLEG